MRQIFALAAMLAVASVLGASSMMARYIKTDTQNYPLLFSSVQVLDSSEEPITDLNQKNFRIRIDGGDCDSLRVESYGKTGRALHIMLCIDASGSMAGAPIAAIKSAIIPFIDEMRSIDKIAVSVYADDYQLLTDFTSDKDLLRKTVNGIKPYGSYTSLYYGAQKALQRLVNIEERTGKIMVLMGDGKDQNPTRSYSENDVIKLAVDNGVPIFTVGYTKSEAIYLQSLERIAETSGGSYYYAPQAKDLSKHFEKLHRQIMNIYVLTYFAVGIPGDGAEHNLGIDVNTSLGEKNLTAKIIAPMGKAAYNKPVPLKSTRTIGKWAWLLIAAGAFAIFITWLLIYQRGKRLKREKEAENLRLEQLRKAAEAERERRAKEELKAEKESSETMQGSGTGAKGGSDSSRDFPDQNDTSRPSKQIMADRERTMILGKGQEPQVQNPGSRVLRMEIVYGTGAGMVFNIDERGATIGRAADNQIILADASVSGHHAKINHVDGFFIIEDLKSTNGLIINGNKTQISRLEGTCTFKFGGVEGTLTTL